MQVIIEKKHIENIRSFMRYLNGSLKIWKWRFPKFFIWTSWTYNKLSENVITHCINLDLEFHFSSHLCQIWLIRD